MFNRRHVRFPLEALILAVLCHALPATAAQGQPSEQGDDCPLLPCAGREPPLRPLLAIVDRVHDSISSRLEAAVRSVDGFFATENVFEETNDSYARIPMDLNLEEGESRFKIRLKGKLSLPNTQKRLKLLIEGDSTRNLSEQELNPTPPSPDTNDDYFLSIETLLRKTAKWKLRPAVGVKVRWTPDLFARLRAIRYFAVTPKWLGRFALTGTALVDAGTESNGDLQFSHALGRDLLFRSDTNVRWTHRKSYTEAAQVLSLFQHLSRKANLAYQAGVFGNDQAGDWDVLEYRCWLRYRRLIYRKWLFMDVIPAVRFPPAEDYEPAYLLTLRIEPVFGKRVPTERLRAVD
ncbi:MAG TPA: hypothetical protein ENK48_02350 [Gammaproteobacteria bacterium]|nr:hypothetical protein [Gammaproteobacteria bacterium]